MQAMIAALASAGVATVLFSSGLSWADPPTLVFYGTSSGFLSFSTRFPATSSVRGW